MKKITKVVLGILLLAILLAGGWYLYTSAIKSPRFNRQIKIGLMGPLTGESSSYGMGMIRGAELAKKELGADNIEIITEDTKCDKSLTPEATRKLIAEGVVAIFGESCSGASLTALPVANEKKIVLISGTSSSPKLSIPNDYFFRVVPPDTFQGRFTAELVYGKGLKKAAIFYSNEPYGADLTGVFKQRFEELGGKVVADVPFERDIINFQKEIVKIKTADPDAIYLVSNSLTSAGAAIRQITEGGIEAKLFGSEALQDQSVINDAGSSAEGLVITAFPSGNKTFKKALKAEYGTDEGLYGAAQAYDVFKALYLTLAKQVQTGGDLRKVLSTIEFDGASAHIKFDSNGEVTENYKYDLWKVENAKFVPAN